MEMRERRTSLRRSKDALFPAGGGGGKAEDEAAAEGEGF
jgi:hypothetical protein